MPLVSRRLMLGGTAALAVTATLAACSHDSSGADSDGDVYFLNFKPESEQAFKEIATAYKDKAGVNVKVVTAASGNYEQTLKAEVAKSNPPTLFNINGPVGYANWAGYASDLSDTEFAKQVTDDKLVLKADDKVVGVPLGIEGYGIIYNAAILRKYFALPGAKATKVDEIKGFDKLKDVVEDMQAKKADLGIEGVFAATSLAPGEEWRWHSHLASYPLFYEYRDDQVDNLDVIKLTYSENYKQIFDLYLSNSTVPASRTTAKTVTDSMADFALGKAAMVQNGNWAWSQISEVEGNTVQAEDVHFLPIYIGVSGEDKAGIAIGTENYLTINSQASEKARKATQDFLTWLFADPEGSALAAEKLSTIAPYKAYTDLKPSDPLGKEVASFMERSELYPVTWAFATLPSLEFKNQLGQHLSQYASGKEDWSKVEHYFVTQWATEKES